MKRFLILVLILCLMGCTTLSNHTKDWRIYDSCEACEKVNTAILVLLIGLMSLCFVNTVYMFSAPHAELP